AKSAVAGNHLRDALVEGSHAAIVNKCVAPTRARAPRAFVSLAGANVQQHGRRHGHEDQEALHGRLQRDAAPIGATNAVLPPGNKYKDCATLVFRSAKAYAAQSRLRPFRTLDCVDGEASWGLAAPSDLPHRDIGALDIVPQSIRIEQWTCLAIV